MHLKTLSWHQSVKSIDNMLTVHFILQDCFVFLIGSEKNYVYNITLSKDVLDKEITEQNFVIFWLNWQNIEFAW